MRYFSYATLGDNDEEVVITLSEDEIKKTYYPYWYDKMCAKYGKDYVNETYSFEECIEDWIAINWAWPVQ